MPDRKFEALTLGEFAKRVAAFGWKRRVNEVHLHHTWRPNHAQYAANPLRAVQGMWRYHTQQLGWQDMGQHVTVGAEGLIWLGRDWNLAPCSQPGHNGTLAVGPFMVEMVGDFDLGRDPWEGAQREASLGVIAAVQGRFGLKANALRFHNQMSKKTCPGTSIVYGDVVSELERRHVALRAA